MTTLNTVTLSGVVGVAPSTAGTEVPDSRRRIYVEDAQWARCSYGGSGLGDCAVGISASLDGGLNWAPLIERGPTVGPVGTVLASDWTDISPIVPAADVLLAAFAYGSSLLGLYTLRFVELQIR